VRTDRPCDLSLLKEVVHSLDKNLSGATNSKNEKPEKEANSPGRLSRGVFIPLFAKDLLILLQALPWKGRFLSAAAAVTAAIALLFAEAVISAGVAVLAVVLFRRGEFLFRLTDQTGRELIAGIRLQIGRILIDSLGETCDVLFQAVALVEQIAA
jgi:hypothetical protein